MNELICNNCGQTVTLLADDKCLSCWDRLASFLFRMMASKPQIAPVVYTPVQLQDEYGRRM